MTENTREFWAEYWSALTTGKTGRFFKTLVVLGIIVGFLTTAAYILQQWRWS